MVWIVISIISAYIIGGFVMVGYLSFESDFNRFGGGMFWPAYLAMLLGEKIRNRSKKK